MAFHTYDGLDSPYGRQAMELYDEAFPREGRKPDHIIAGMFAKKLSRLHVEVDGGEVSAMAIDGLLPESDWLVIDYLAVRKGKRGQGIGRTFVRELESWARSGERKLAGLLLEAEADPGQENVDRVRFWESCGFIATEYVHHYIWVPETYRAMYLPFDPDFQPSDRGESLFRHIERFHKKAFTR
ncbi:GNAT family N-acetyltransferase [Cohnella candidum]|uniref:GNAT family N-acetyltransferase n=1 Tax=Cohnella candidum TaxID=2674991 RepID=A0A3G3JV82_9BACL|nr:GNAT family N-acetyltransferase [Cohnella candidum]AYQ72150.1 GNAT family N-acetyltransferase [Cohnella candidum]